MVNELRTLLLNPTAAVYPISYPGEEYIPPDFPHKTLPQALLRVHQLLFGRNPDRAMLNYRLRQYMGMLHASRLSEFATALDPRITYWPPHDQDFLLPDNFGATVTKVGATTTNLYPQEAYPVTALEALLKEWLITVVNGSDVRVTQTIGGVATSTLPYVITSGVSDVLTIPATNLGFFFEAGVGAVWTYRWLARPAFSLRTVLASLEYGIGDEAQLALFGDSTVEPYRTFNNLWLLRTEFPVRIGAIVLALAYRIREL